MRDSPKGLGLCLVLIIADHTWKEGANFVFSFNIAASSYKSGEFFRKHQLQGIANKQTTSEEVIVDVTGEEENEVRSFEDLENNIADSDRGKASEECAKTTTGTRKRRTTQNQGKKKKKRPNKFSGTPEKAEDLLKYLQDYKSSCYFKGIDFEADLACIPKCESSWREVMLRPLAQKKSVPQEEESRKWARMNMINTSSKSRLNRR